MGEYGNKSGIGLSGLPEPYNSELTALWNTWLIKKYGSTPKLSRAWHTTDQTSGSNLYPFTPDPKAWTLEVQPGAEARLSQEGNAVRADITKIDDTNWHVQLYRKGMGILQNGKTYTITLEAKADRNRDQPIGANLDHPGYGSIGLSGAMHLSTEFRTFAVTFTANNAEDGQNRLPSLLLGTQTGSVWLRSITLKPGSGAYSLPSDQTLDAHNIPLDPSGEGHARADWLSFLQQTEDAYALGMRAFLRHDLQVKTTYFLFTGRVRRFGRCVSGACL